MPRLRHLRLAARFARHRFGELHPYEVQAVLLNACNLKCSCCRCPEIKTSLLTTEQWLATVRRLGELGTLRLKWQGGEPTLRSDFVELCAEVQRAGILCAVVTNGTKIAEKPSLLDHLDEVVFSFDAPTAEVNDITRGRGVHAQVMEAIEVARARADLRLFVNMVVGVHNFEAVESMLRFCEERGIGMNAQPITFGVSFYDEGARPLALNGEQTRELFRRLAAWKRQGRPLMFMATTYDNSAAWPDYAQNTRQTVGESGCAMGRFYVHIEANGDVHPCVQHEGPFQAKNLVRDGIEEAIRHASRHNCGSCYSAYLNERKAVFGLRPRAVAEFLRRE